MLTLPLLVLLMVVSVAGLGTWLTAPEVLYCYGKHAVTLLMQMLMYGVRSSALPARSPNDISCYYALNPMVGVI